jgi:UDP-glucose 4-epimerase
MGKILVAGGAGYIGSHFVWLAIQQKREIVVYDSLVKGHPEAIQGVKMVEGDIADTEHFGRILKEENIEYVVHFAADIEVGESFENPKKYYVNNVVKTNAMLNTMLDCGVKKIIFSSTAAIFGEPEEIPISEDARQVPTNPYGDTKLAIERMMRWYDGPHGLKSICLRYFNAAGAAENGEIGEAHDPETHLIPLVLQVANKKRENIHIFGTDYPTRDGTCIRDYVHILDLAEAHLLAMDYLDSENQSDYFNLGNGEGFTVREVIETARKVTGHAIPAVETGRRGGDPAVLVASSEKIKKVLGWKPKYASLEKIIQTAWTWHAAHPEGYGT